VEKLSDLVGIPHDTRLKTRKRIAGFLKTYLCFVHFSIAAVEAFLRGDLEQFDAHVGETACQIRAYRVFLLFHLHDGRSRPGLRHALSALKKIQEIVVSHIELGLPMKNAGVSACGLLKDMDVDLVCDQDLLFLIMTYFLKQFSVIDDEDEIGSYIRNMRQEDLPEGLSRNLFEQAIKRCQRKVSEDSCRFILQLLQELDGLSPLKEVSPHFIKRDELGREVLPAFLSGHVIFRHLLTQSHLPAALIVVVRQEGVVDQKFHLSLTANKKGDEFDVGLSPSLETPCLIMKGELRAQTDKQGAARSVASYGALRILDAFMAAHRQYSGQHLRGSEDVFDRLHSLHAKENPAVAEICRRYFDSLWLGKKLLSRELDAFLLRHMFSGLLSKTL
jgi:hypothetical protein